jgi:hypothetical protein
MTAVNRLVIRAMISEPIYVKWKGAGGEAYCFELNPIGTPHRALPGVYIFCHFGALNALVADYLDEVDDFSRRIGNDVGSHPHWEEIKAAGATHVCTLHVPGKAAERVKIEADLRRAVDPPQLGRAKAA